MKKKILLVEDEPHVSECIEAMLIQHGFEVAVLNQGSQVEGQVSKERPDLIVMDIMIPEPNGVEVCKRLKKDERTKSIPVILLSAKSQEQDIGGGFQAGAERYIVKPFKNSDLLNTIHNLIG